MADVLRVSIIVLNFNGAAILPRCLDALLAQTYASREILVVDNASSDGSDAVLAAYAARGVHVVASPTNRGCAGGRNVGLAAARGDVVAFMDNDGYADPRWLEAAMTVLDADEGVGAVAPLVFLDRQGLVLNGAGGTLNRRGYGGDHCFQEPFEFARLPNLVLYPMGCGMVVRRRVLEAMSGFDEELFNYYDDVEVGVWSWRLGLQVVCAPAAWVDHGFGTSNTITRNKIALCERNRIRTVLKYFPPRLLPAWLLHEAASLLLPRAPASWAIPWQAWRWNLAHLASTLRRRRHFAPEAGRFDALLHPSWGSFPPPRPANHLLEPDLARAGSAIAFATDAPPAALVYGWYPVERDGSAAMRWTTGAASALLRLDAPAARLDAEWRTVRPDQDVTARLRHLDDLALAWEWSGRPGTTWTAASLPCSVPAGSYELQLLTTPSVGDPGGRALGVGVVRLALT